MSKIPNIQLLLFDVDGTLVNKEKQIPQATIEALKSLSKTEIKFGVATSRHFAALKNYIFKFFPAEALHIVTNGGQIINTKGEIIWEKLIPSKKVREIVSQIEYLGGAVIYGHSDSLYCSQGVFDNLSKHPWNIKTKLIDRNLPIPTPLVSVVQLNQKVRNYIESLSNLAVMLLGDSTERQYYDITAYGVNKAIAMKKLCKLLEVNIENTMAIGDNINDTEILQAVKTGVAMSHAPDAVKSAASIVITDETNEGMANFLKEYVI